MQLRRITVSNVDESEKRCPNATRVREANVGTMSCYVSKVPTSGLMHRRPSHRQAIGDEQCQAVSDDLRLAAAVKGHAASGPRVEVISRRNISRKHGFCRCGLSIKAGGSAALA
jgi:hypothetical protein